MQRGQTYVIGTDPSGVAHMYEVGDELRLVSTLPITNVAHGYSGEIFPFIYADSLYFAYAWKRELKICKVINNNTSSVEAEYKTASASPYQRYKLRQTQYVPPQTISRLSVRIGNAISPDSRGRLCFINAAGYYTYIYMRKMRAKPTEIYGRCIYQHPIGSHIDEWSPSAYDPVNDTHHFATYKLDCTEMSMNTQIVYKNIYLSNIIDSRKKFYEAIGESQPTYISANEITLSAHNRDLCVSFTNGRLHIYFGIDNHQARLQFYGANIMQQTISDAIDIQVSISAPPVISYRNKIDATRYHITCEDAIIPVCVMQYHFCTKSIYI